MMSYIQLFNDMLMDFCVEYQYKILYTSIAIIAISPFILMESRLHENSRNYLLIWLVRNIWIIVAYFGVTLMIITPLCIETQLNEINVFFWIQVILGVMIIKITQTMLFEFWEWLPEKPIA